MGRTTENSVFRGAIDVGVGYAMRLPNNDPQKQIVTFMVWTILIFMVMDYALYRWDTYKSKYLSNTTSVQYSE